MKHAVDPLTKPRTFAELRDALAELAGIDVSVATLYRLAKLGGLPYTEVGGRKRSTVAAVVEAMTPKAVAK